MYYIVDNNGDVWASHIKTKSKAETILIGIIDEIGKQKANEIEIEIIEV